MPISPEQREERKKFIGSSDAAAILGLDKYRTPYDVWADKSNLLETKEYLGNEDAIDIGNYCERGVLEWFGQKKGLALIFNDETHDNRRVHVNGFMAANFDALVAGDDTQACEAKTHGVVSLYVSDEWGEEGTDEVPERVALQCQHQMACLPSIQIVHIPVLLGGVGLRAYFQERNETLIKNLTEYSEHFWNEYVLKQVPPPDAVPSMDTVKKLKRTPNKTVEIPSELFAEWRRAKDALKAAEEEKNKKELLLFSALGDAEAGDAGPLGSVTYYLRERKGYEVKPSVFRQLQYLKPKGDKRGK